MLQKHTYHMHNVAIPVPYAYGMKYGYGTKHN